MKTRKLAAIGIILLMLSGAALAYFGETASKKQRLELEFRGTFVLVMYYLLYGKFLDEKTDTGLMDLFGDLDELILMNPPLDFYIIHNIIRYFIIIMEPLYITALLVTGLYLMFFSGSPQGRHRARTLLPYLAASIIVVSLSFQILQLMFNVSRSLAEGILAAGNGGADKIFVETIDELLRIFTTSTLINFDGGFIFLTLIFALVLGLFTLLALRYVMVLAFTLIFPVSIILYTFGPTKKMGRMMLEQLIIWTFLQGVIALIAVVVNAGVGFFGVGGDLKTILGVTAYLSIIVSPFIIAGVIKRFLP